MIFAPQSPICFGPRHNDDLPIQLLAHDWRAFLISDRFIDTKIDSPENTDDPGMMLERTDLSLEGQHACEHR
jgi:hypothetical protein